MLEDGGQANFPYRVVLENLQTLHGRTRIFISARLEWALCLCRGRFGLTFVTIGPAVHYADAVRFNQPNPKVVGMIDSSGTPAVVHFAGKLWMAWKGEGADTRVYISSFSASTWSECTPISGISTRSYPALAVSVAELYLVWRAEHDNTIYWSRSFDGKVWSPPARAPGAGTGEALTRAGFEEVVDYPWDIETEEAIDSWSEENDGRSSAPGAVLEKDSEAGGERAMESGDPAKLHLVWNRMPCKTSWARKTKSRFPLRPALVLTEREARQIRPARSVWISNSKGE
jgi:hypothetical protein